MDGPTTWQLSGGNYSASGEGQGFSSGPVPAGSSYTASFSFNIEFYYYNEGDDENCQSGESESGDCEGWDYLYASASIDVPYPPPQINSLSTYSVYQGDQGTLTVTGSNFIDSAGDQLSLNFSGGGNPFTLTSTPSICTTTCTATFSYNFSGYPPNSYTLSVSNNEDTSNNETFTVISGQTFPPDPCAVTSNPKVGFTSIVTTGTVGGSGTMAVSFSGSAFAAVSPSVTYGPYSTPSSIASSMAALITKKYLQYGLTAKAFGPNIVYGGITTLGSVSNSVTGLSFTTDASSTAAAGAAVACYALGHIPCLGLHPDYDTPRLYKQAGITETPRQHITRKHIVGPPTLVPKNTVYTGNGGVPPAFTLVQGYNFTTVLENPLGAKTTNGIVFKHTFQKTTTPVPGGYYESGWIGADASGNDLYTNNLYLSADRCTVDTSFPTP